MECCHPMLWSCLLSKMEPVSSIVREVVQLDISFNIYLLFSLHLVLSTLTMLGGCDRDVLMGDR